MKKLNPKYDDCYEQGILLDDIVMLNTKDCWQDLNNGTYWFFRKNLPKPYVLIKKGTELFKIHNTWYVKYDLVNQNEIEQPDDLFLYNIKITKKPRLKKLSLKQQALNKLNKEEKEALGVQ
jgi:hypothetical protein